MFPRWPEAETATGVIPRNIAHADWLIDLDPDAGHDGGRVDFVGRPAALVAARATLTGQHLAAYVES